MAGDSCWRWDAVLWPGLLRLTGQAQGCQGCASIVGACLSGNASGTGTAGRGLPWDEDKGCLAGLRSGGWWLPSDTPNAASLGHDQDGGGGQDLPQGYTLLDPLLGMIPVAHYLHLLIGVWLALAKEAATRLAQ